MELLVLGIGIMALGAAILHLAIEGRKAAPVQVAASRTMPRPHLLSRVEPIKAAARTRFAAIAVNARVAAVEEDDDIEEPDFDEDLEDEQPVLRPIRSESFGKADILLADALTELIDLKEQVMSLQARVDELTAEAAAHTSKPAVARPVAVRSIADTRPAPRQIRRRTAHGMA
jgi:hypothetical protein